MSVLGRSVLWLARILAALILLWLAGLVWFVASSYWIRPDPSNTTDAIVVVTGGRLRLEAGLELFAAGKAKKLFISGVNQHVDRDELLHTLGPVPENAACCIVIGHSASDTFGNARETAEWMHGEGYRSLRLVTSWYHMQRSLLEFGRAMPQAWNRHGAPLLVLGEYDKYLITLALPLLQAWWPPPAAGPVLRTAGDFGPTRAYAQ